MLVADQPQEYANLILEIASNPDAFREIRLAAKKYIVENNSWERAGGIYTAAIQAVLSGS